MKLADARNEFINKWGAFGSHWGINRTMAQVHALLLISADPLSQDDIMEQLNVSRGNANMNIRELIDWGLVERIIISGERREFFVAEKDIWKVATQILRERKKREFDPMMKVVESLENIEGDKKDKNHKQFTETIGSIKSFGRQADRMMDVMVKADENWFIGSLMKFFK
ncbi:GbsR/MarR family transcriptional regulator [Pseudobacter ginsenosidimutans]|uniref:HTH-type transcriptional regulator n=1 Tax=Pseudobacter ginsenosidimutans TaxID=661488 RepID=A0A4Q7MQW2_9BACT|nr:MarR family transcriptional regulator [Pseudobacter ginsenosidimutans]QEC42220.1 MarR family transcriptional regulator [Pseudobacter ginsenosidimutans]RZS70937.1 DNA-binding transcriptional regulator GbsR (MarR family) [Pseudobacter ginsenosidimutans]